MMTYYKKQKGHRDDNEPEILEAVNVAGYHEFSDFASKDVAIGSRGFYIKGGSKDGSDLFFFDSCGAFVVEVKNRDGRNRMEAAERIMQHLCASIGLPYFIVWSPDDMMDVVNGRV